MIDGYRLLAVPGGFVATPMGKPMSHAEYARHRQADAMEMVTIIVAGILAGESETQLQERCDPGQLDFLYPAACACLPAVRAFVENWGSER